MSKRSRRNSEENFKKKRTIRSIGLIALMAIICTISVTVVGFASNGFQDRDVASWMESEVNEENLIKADAYQIKDDQDDGKGIKARVNDDGVIKLSGKATSDNSIVVTNVTLAPGTYTISGMNSGDNYGLKVVGPNLEAKAGTSSATFTLETSQVISVVIYVAEDTLLFNKTVKPVLVTGTEAGDFYQ